jgi:hypothetical protein
MELLLDIFDILYKDKTHLTVNKDILPGSYAGNTAETSHDHLTLKHHRMLHLEPQYIHSSALGTCTS